ncbi:hypothetical protein DSO57_1035303 [Entomophthora muscae]|uniref:Uncharacterized protein n=1 Tax=Entomophthora muscae TaxID=34485 RepID=A0ACC2UKC0_9FUNG|nr:hypothetical protein DSO57_1035303 [Entomophthora muscae]
MIPETRKIEYEPIYAADSLTLSQMKVFLMYLCIIFCCTFPYSLFKGYHLQVNTHCLLLIGNIILIWMYIPHLINYNKLSLSLYFTLTLSNYFNFDILYGLRIFVVRSFSCIMDISVSFFALVFFPLLYPSFEKIEITQPRHILLSHLKFWQPAPCLPSPLLNTAREILALTEEWTQHGFPQKLLSFLLKQAEPKSCEWCLSILDQAPNSFDNASTLIPLVTCQAPATSSLIDYKTLFSSSQGPQPLPLHLKQFQANAKKSSLPKSAKLAALYLSLDHTGQSLSPWLHPSTSVSDMIQHLLQAVRGKLVTSQQPTQPLLLEAPPMLNCLKCQQEPATSQGPISPEVSQSLVTPAPTLALAPVVSSPPWSISTLATLSLYNIDNSSATRANLNSIDSQAPTSGTLPMPVNLYASTRTVHCYLPGLRL